MDFPQVAHRLFCLILRAHGTGETGNCVSIHPVVDLLLRLVGVGGEVCIDLMLRLLHQDQTAELDIALIAGRRKDPVVAGCWNGGPSWMAISDAELEGEFTRRNEKVKLQVVAQTAEAFRDKVTVTDADVVCGEGRQIVFVEPSSVPGLPLSEAAAIVVPLFLESAEYASLLP